jgi:Ca-activated chloride channel family protein
VKFIPLLIAIAGFAWSGLWFTPDQQGQRQMKRDDFRAAAETFRDPLWQGVALFRSGEFKEAEQAFARAGTAEAEFNRGNCLVMQGKYQAAVARYDRALQLLPDWEDALINREIAMARAKLVERQGDDMGDQKLGADEITFDKGANRGGQETEGEGEPQLSDAEMQALWLRRVQTRPADFLKAKFAYQNATRAATGDDQ